MENQKIVFSIFLNLSAAFNTVDHDLLLSVLNKSFGTTGDALLSHENYLRPRSFKVYIQNQYSSEEQLKVSVPQGSTSGTNIFDAYYSSLFDVICSQVYLQSFADDHFMHKDADPKSKTSINDMIKLLENSIFDIKKLDG